MPTRTRERAKIPVHLDERRGLDDDCWSCDSGAQKPAVKSDQFAEYAEAGEDQDDQRPGHGTIQKCPHGSPQFIATIPGCPSRPNGWDRLALFLEYVGDALNHLRIGVLDVVARLLWRNSRFARAMVMAMR